MVKSKFERQKEKNLAYKCKMVNVINFGKEKIDRYFYYLIVIP